MKKLVNKLFKRIINKDKNKMEIIKEAIFYGTCPYCYCKFKAISSDIKRFCSDAESCLCPACGRDIIVIFKGRKTSDIDKISYE